MDEIYGSNNQGEKKWEIIRVRKKNFGQEVELRIKDIEVNEVTKLVITVEELVDLFINHHSVDDKMIISSDDVMQINYYPYFFDRED